MPTRTDEADRSYPVIVAEAGHDMAHILWDAHFAPFEDKGEFGCSFPGFESGTSARSATVEIYRQTGGGPQRAILGGIKRASTGTTLPTSGPFDEMPGIPSKSISGASFSAGLRIEQLHPVLTGLLHWPTTAGELRVMSAAYHDEGTSWFAQLIAAQILSKMLHAKSDDLTETDIDTIRRLLRTSARVHEHEVPDREMP